MPFIADLHIHSRFSRATSKQLSPAHLAGWARCKGIDLLGTGDFTHPQWRQELRDCLVEDTASGLYRLREHAPLPDLPVEGGLPVGNDPLFLLQTEISSIYKRHGKVRKVHNLVFVPTLEDAERLSRRLEGIGNLASDGRPILGLDSRDLLEICLETCPRAVLIPAHVWTPWFALFGSKSGFDRLEDCFGDLSSHIFALETGLSSDPAMNRLVSALDGYALISNSDAHSGANLGREANLFDGSPSYDGLFDALRRSARHESQDGQDCRFLGTLEFYPEEGKYHLDGHRACQVVMSPREALACGNICPVCGKPLTIGVLHRVWELADREEPARLSREPAVHPLIPLPELVGELLGVGAASRKVRDRYARLLRELGPEMDILCRLPLADLSGHWPLLGEAVGRMRRGEVYREGGYDGEYGVVRVLSPDEAAQLHGKPRSRKATPAQPAAPAPGTAHAPSPAPRALCLLDGIPLPARPTVPHDAADSLRAFRAARAPQDAPAPEGAPSPEFSDEQRAALAAGPEPVLVLAGPGAGKTRVLVGRLLSLLACNLPAEDLLAITFTRRAAAEMRQRLQARFPAAAVLPSCDTLHALAWDFLRQGAPQAVLLSEEAARDIFRLANPGLDADSLRRHFDAYALWREQEQHGRRLPPDAGELPLLGTPSLPWLTAARAYDAFKQSHQPRLHDYADLLDSFLLAAKRGELPARQHVLVDEIQDLSPKQLAIVRALLPEDGCGFFGIGDPDQAIYGFRGATGQSEESIREIWPALRVFRLACSYRAGQAVLDAARLVLQQNARCGELHAARPLETCLRLFTAPTPQAEARWIADHVRRLLGSSSLTLHREGQERDTTLEGRLAPGDIAVLVRIRAQIPPILAALTAAGIPCDAPAEESCSQDDFCRAVLFAAAQSCGQESLVPPSWAEAARRLADTAAGLDPHMLAPRLLDAGTPLPPERIGKGLCSLLGWDATRTSLALNRPVWRRLCRQWHEKSNWPDLLQSLAWEDEAESLRPRAELVQIMTMHASKGLEFRAVFLPGLEDGLLPLRRECLLGQPAPDAAAAGQLPQLPVDERRLLYVALTRAAQGIYASRCRQRTLYGQRLQLPPSPFLPLVQACFRQSALTARIRQTPEQLSLL
ncbi:UvrD-helicase domain-containing protein [uncultured Desulfovibrio sp.]|uniref:UvrD-helicase domain-containing protein n=1 Tax=uncultured Desulfovibrio sp. TaxID=167968 RepID=UPI00262235C4|nr:UvrD-helicase domain-containing protein [uncultured Desulfovibrio sp.]